MKSNLTTVKDGIILRKDFQELSLESQTFILMLIEDAIGELKKLEEHQRELKNEYRN